MRGKSRFCALQAMHASVFCLVRSASTHAACPRHLDVSTSTAQLLVWLLGMMGSALEGSCGEAQEA